MGAQVRYKNREKKLFDLLEDKLEFEDERSKMIEYEKDERQKAINSGDLPSFEEDEQSESHLTIGLQVPVKKKQTSIDLISLKSKKE